MNAVEMDLDQRSLSADDDDLTHLMCCRDENVALCGCDIADAPVVQDSSPDEVCVVCADLDSSGSCPRGFQCPPWMQP